MTGFGAGRATVGGEEVAVEVRSVNHKFCEVKARLPRELAALETVAQKRVRDTLARGAVDLQVKRVGAQAAGLEPRVDEALARAWVRAYEQVARATGLGGEATLAAIAGLPGVVKLDEASVDLEAAGRALEQAMDQALAALVAMREVEGAAISKDLLARLDRVSALAGELRALGPRALDEYRARFHERIAELARGVAVDPQRLAQEVAIWAERTDVAEELTRLDSHLAQFRSLLQQKEQVGRKLDFLLQEMNREVNTTGSKSQHPDLSSRVVELKAELERVREQVQNVE